MHNCQSLDALVTPFVDGELADAERRAVEDHLQKCPPCHSRVAAERAVHDLLHARKPMLGRTEAPDALHARCAALASRSAAADAAASGADGANSQRAIPTTDPRFPISEFRVAASEFRPDPPIANLGASIPSVGAVRWRAGRVAPYALAASFVVAVGGAFLYQATNRSSRVLAAELVADHAKCFALNNALGTRQASSAVEASMASSFDWRMHLPDDPARAGLELVGARTCLYDDGRVAHIMYRHQGQPVSLFMLPHTERAQELVEVLGHEAAIWCANNRTYVLVAREPRQDVERMASYVRASLH